VNRDVCPRDMEVAAVPEVVREGVTPAEATPVVVDIEMSELETESGSGVVLRVEVVAPDCVLLSGDVGDWDTPNGEDGEVVGREGEVVGREGEADGREGEVVGRKGEVDGREVEGVGVGTELSVPQTTEVETENRVEVKVDGEGMLVVTSGAVIASPSMTVVRTVVQVWLCATTSVIGSVVVRVRQFSEPVVVGGVGLVG